MKNIKLDQQLKEVIAKVVAGLYPDHKISPENISLEHPNLEEYGDFSSSVALKLARDVKQKPVEMANKIAQKLDQSSLKDVIFEKVTVAEPGFVNFFLSSKYLQQQVIGIQTLGDDYGKGIDKGTIVVEFVSPNINKPLHIGHLRNAALGMSIAELYKKLGWKVYKDEINNDRGLHIMKSVLGYLIDGQKNKEDNKFDERNWRELLALWVANPNDWKEPAMVKPDQFVGHYYMQGERFLKEMKEPMEKNLSEMLQAWEKEEKEIWQLWKVMGDWVREGLNETYKRIGVSHDKEWYESELYKEGRDIVLEGLAKGVFEKLPDGAIQANLEAFGMDNKVLVRRDGTSIYMTFDIALTKHKVQEFKADRYVWIVGSDQIDHFKRLFAIFQLLGLGKIGNFYHLAYGMVRVPGGKMSSRMGNVILADDVLEEMKKMALKIMDEKKIESEVQKAERDSIAESVGVGAIKYSMLKVNPMVEVTFDLEKSVSLEGDSGPYIQYSYARARSLLRKAAELEPVIASEAKQSHEIATSHKIGLAMTKEEVEILRYLYRFPEVVEMAARQFAPNLIASYLFEIARRFNAFYNEVQIIGGDNEALDLALTEATSIVIKNGLTLLGIEALERM